MSQCSHPVLTPSLNTTTTTTTTTTPTPPTASILIIPAVPNSKSDTKDTTSKMPEPQSPDRRIPATAFTLFNYLPEEVRIQIWVEALPGPRIIYIQRLHKSGKYSPWPWCDVDSDHPLPTYFISPSPNDSIISLLHACKESYSVVEKRYSLILPKSSTWFSFSRDFLFLDLGRNKVPYCPQHFTASWPDDYWSDKFEHPEISEDVARQVRNLVVFDRLRSMDNMEDWLSRDVLGVFTGVKLLVMADRLFNENESSEELVWLGAKMGNGFEENKQPEEEEERWQFLRNLILWRDWTQYELCSAVDEERLERIWSRFVEKEDHKIPKIVTKSITTAKVKKGLLEICRSEDTFWKLKGLDWDFVMGEKEYTGDLDFTQQIAFLELAIERTSMNYGSYDMDQQGVRMEGTSINEVPVFLRKIDALMLEREMLELVICDAEEMG